MKKVFFAIVAASALTFTACNNNKPADAGNAAPADTTTVKTTVNSTTMTDSAKSTMSTDTTTGGTTGK